MKKMMYAACLFLAAAVLMGAEQSAASLRRLSIEDAVDYAGQHNLSLKRSKITLEAAERSKNTSWNSISPSLAITAQASADDDALSDYKNTLIGTASFSFSPNLFTTIESVRLSYEAGKISYSEALRTVELSVRQSFYALLYEKENSILQQRNLETARQQWQTNLAKYQQGRMSELDVLSAEVKYKNLLPTVESARVTYQNDLASFKQLLNLPQSEEIELSGTLDDVLSLGEISLDSSNLSSPTLEKLELELSSERTSLLSKRFSAYAPVFKASYQHGLLPEEDQHSQTSGLLDRSGTISLSASIPLDGFLPWSSAALAIDNAKDSLHDLELQIQEEKISLQVTAESNLRTIAQSRASLLSKQASVTLARRTYEMTEEAYNRGTKDLLSLQNASDSLLAAEVSLKNEEVTLINAVLSLEKTLGLPFGSLGRK